MSAGIRSAAALGCKQLLALQLCGTVLFPSSSAVCLLFVSHGA
jgi:hypothetical protein